MGKVRGVQGNPITNELTKILVEFEPVGKVVQRLFREALRALRDAHGRRRAPCWRAPGLIPAGRNLDTIAKRRACEAFEEWRRMSALYELAVLAEMTLRGVPWRWLLGEDDGTHEQYRDRIADLGGNAEVIDLCLSKAGVA